MKKSYSKSVRANTNSDGCFVFTAKQRDELDTLADHLYDVDAILYVFALACKGSGVRVGAGPAVERPASPAIDALRRRVQSVAEVIGELGTAGMRGPNDVVPEEGELRALAACVKELSELDSVFAVYVAAFESESLQDAPCDAPQLAPCECVDATRPLDVAHRDVVAVWMRLDPIVETYRAHVKAFPRVHIDPTLGDKRPETESAVH